MKRCLNCMEEYAENLTQCPVCGYSGDMDTGPEPALEPGSILQGRYIVGVCREVRKSDIIYIGWDELFQRKVQILEFYPAYCCPVRGDREAVSVFSSKGELFEKGKRQFLTYGKKLLWLYREEDIAAVYSCFEENDTAYLITQYCDLPTVEEYLYRNTSNGAAVSVHTALTLLSEAITAVEKVHGIGVYHGQISAESFWITEDKRLVLKDFGSWLYVCGEPGGLDYQNGGPWTDVYGLVSMFCQMVTGTAVTPAVRVESVIADSGIGKRPNLSRAVMNALEESPSRRTGSVEELSLQIYGKKKARNRRNKQNKSFLEKISWKLYACGGLLLIVLIAATAVFYKLGDGRKIGIVESREDGSIVIENLINQKYEKVLKSHDIADQRIKVEVMGVPESENVEGIIVEQVPGAGEKGDNVSTIKVIVDSDKIPVTVPEITGIQVGEARRLLFEAGLRTRVSEKQYEAVPGSIVEWSSEDGEAVHLGSEILLTAAVGETLPDKEELVKVPELTGQNYEEAEKILKDSGLYMIKGQEVYSDDYAENVVTTQSLQAGSNVIKGKTNVVVTVSKGREPVAIPELVKKTAEEAEKELKAAGLALERRNEYDDAVKKGVVIRQEPEAGEGRKGDKVIITVSLGNRPQETKETKENGDKPTKAPVKRQDKNSQNGKTPARTETVPDNRDQKVPDQTETVRESPSQSEPAPSQGGAAQEPPGKDKVSQEAPTLGPPTPGGPAAANPPMNPES